MFEQRGAQQLGVDDDATPLAAAALPVDERSNSSDRATIYRNRHVSACMTAIAVNYYLITELEMGVAGCARVGAKRSCGAALTRHRNFAVLGRTFARDACAVRKFLSEHKHSAG